MVVPAFANAHTHLDLTRAGPLRADPSGGFMAFVDAVRRHRPVSSDAIIDAVNEGIRLSFAGGVVAVGDIAGAALGVPRLEPLFSLRASALAGVSFIEFFAIGKGEVAGLARLEGCLRELDRLKPVRSDVCVGLSPHATNTVSIDAYRASAAFALARNMPLMTHAAETPEEREFIARGTGPQREFLERIQLWDDSLLASIGKGVSPIAHLGTLLGSPRMTLVHVNDADDDDISLIAASGSSVVYCPRASAYFLGPEHFGPHPYAKFRAAGIRVAIGTDSIINLDRADRITPFDDASLLVRRDDLDPRIALAMITTEPASILQLEPRDFTFAPGSSVMGCVAIAAENPSDWSGVFRTDSELELLR